MVRKKQFRRAEKWYELRQTSDAEIDAFTEEIKALRAQGFALWKRLVKTEIHKLRILVRSRLPAVKARPLLGTRRLPLRRIAPKKLRCLRRPK